jgi:hypothetical protein
LEKVLTNSKSYAIIRVQKRKEMIKMNETRCPYCNAVIEFDDEFTSFDDQGDCIVASGAYECECGNALRVKATFVWDGNLEVD